MFFCDALGCVCKVICNVLIYIPRFYLFFFYYHGIRADGRYVEAILAAILLGAGQLRVMCTVRKFFFTGYKNANLKCVHD